MTLKPDLVKLRADLVREYRDYPNPDGDFVAAFEAKAAEIIADFAILAMTETERGIPLAAALQGVIGVASIVLQNIILNIDEDLREGAVAFSLQTLLRNLSHDQPGEIEIATIDVGDA